MTKTREFHELANVFPMLSGDEAKALAHDILEHGLREPITLLEGKILDGRNRYIACRDAGVEPRFTPYKGDNPAAYVVSLNLKRRHLDESQRAMVAKKLATLEHGQRQTGKFAGVTTQAEAASMLKVSERSVRTAGAVIDKAVPAIVTAVEKGDVSVSAAAQFAKQPKEEQAQQIAESATPANAVKAFRDSRQIGSAEAVGDDGPPVVYPNVSKAFTHLNGAVNRFAEFCRDNSPASVAADILPGEVAEVRVSLAVIREWRRQFFAALGRVEATHIAAKAAEGPRGPDVVPLDKHVPVVAARDDPVPCPAQNSGSKMGEFCKMEYDAWDEGNVELSLEEEAAYLRLCHQMYRRNRPVPNSLELLCTLWRCHASRAKRLLFSLLSKGKIAFDENEQLTNNRTSGELANREQLSASRAHSGQFVVPVADAPKATTVKRKVRIPIPDDFNLTTGRAKKP